MSTCFPTINPPSSMSRFPFHSEIFAVDTRSGSETKGGIHLRFFVIEKIEEGPTKETSNVTDRVIRVEWDRLWPCSDWALPPLYRYSWNTFLENYRHQKSQRSASDCLSCLHLYKCWQHQPLPQWCAGRISWIKVNHTCNFIKLTVNSMLPSYAWRWTHLLCRLSNPEKKYFCIVYLFPPPLVFIN